MNKQNDVLPAPGNQLSLAENAPRKARKAAIIAAASLFALSCTSFHAFADSDEIFTTRDLAQFLHVFGHDVGQRVVVLVLQLAGLEVDVGVLGGAARDGVLRVECSVAVFLQSLVIDELAELLHVGGLHLLDFV